MIGTYDNWYIMTILWDMMGCNGMWLINVMYDMFKLIHMGI